MNIEVNDNKAEHTVALGNLLPLVKEKLTQRKYGEAYALLSDMGTHIVALKGFCQLRIVEDR